MTEILKSQGRCHFTIVKKNVCGDECHLTVVLRTEERNKLALCVAWRKATVFGPALSFCYMDFTESSDSNVRLYFNNNINNNSIYLLQLGCHPVAVVILHVYKT